MKKANEHRSIDLLAVDRTPDVKVSCIVAIVHNKENWNNRRIFFFFFKSLVVSLLALGKGYESHLVYSLLPSAKDIACTICVICIYIYITHFY